MQNIMILGASDLQIPLIQQVEKSGYNSVVISPDSEEPGFKYATNSVISDVRDVETILMYAKQYKIVGILTDQTDLPVRTAAYIAEELNLPTIGRDVAHLFTDKFLMREKCIELNIPTLKYKKVENLNDAMSYFESINCEVILKPVDNQGSKGIYVIRTKEELKEKFSSSQAYSKQKEILIEEYVVGKEFIVEGLVRNGKYESLTCGEYNHFNIPNVFSSAATFFPPSKNYSYIEELKSLNEKIIVGFNLKNGRTHSEFIVSEKGEIFLIETAARGGGVFISSDIVPLTTGINNEELLIDLAVKGTSDIQRNKAGSNYCCCLSFYLPEGEIVSIKGLDKVKNMSSTYRNNFDGLYVGMKTQRHTDKTGRTFVIISTQTPKELNENIKEIRELVNIKVATIHGIQGPIWK